MKHVGALICLAVLSFGCQKKPSIEGTWTISDNVLQGVGSSGTVNFADGKATLKITGTVPPEYGGGELIANANGSYKMAEGKLTVTIDTLKLDASKLSAAMQAMTKQQENDPQGKKLLGEALSGTVTFEEDKAKVALAGGKTMTLTRQ